MSRVIAIEQFIRENWSSIDHGGRSVAEHCLGVGHLLQAVGAEPKIVRCGLMHVISGAESYPELGMRIKCSGAHLLEEAEQTLIQRYSEVSEESLFIVGLTRNAGFLVSRYDGRAMTLDRKAGEEVCLLLLANIAEQFIACPNAPWIRQQRRELSEALAGLGEIAGYAGARICTRVFGNGDSDQLPPNGPS